MKQVENIIKFNTYADSSLLNNYMYMKRDTTEYDVYYIFRLDEIIATNPPEYVVYKCYALHIPKENKKKCIVKDDVYNIQLRTYDTIYILDRDEYINMFRNFVKYEGLFKEELPEDIMKNSES